MFRLYKYELKKIFSQKYFVLAFVLLFLFSMGVSITPIITGSISAVKQKDIISGRVLDDSLFEEFYEDRKNDAYYDINEFIKYSLNKEEFDDVSASEIYEGRFQQLQKEFNTDNLSEGERQYWLNKEKEIEKPFVYLRDDAYAEIYNVVYVLNFAVLILIALAITGVFADEKIAGADQILFSSKYGRSKLFTAKALASLTVGFIVPTIMYETIVGVNLAVYGLDGYNAAIQIHMPTSLYSFSMGDSVLIMYGQLLAASFTYVGFALLLSIATNNHSASTASMVVLMFLSMFNIPARYRVISQIWDLIPSGHIGSWSLLKMQLIKVFGNYYNSIEYSPVVWLILTIVFILISKQIYKRYEVSGR